MDRDPRDFEATVPTFPLRVFVTEARAGELDRFPGTTGKAIEILALASLGVPERVWPVASLFLEARVRRVPLEALVSGEGLCALLRSRLKLCPNVEAETWAAALLDAGATLDPLAPEPEAAHA